MSNKKKREALQIAESQHGVHAIWAEVQMGLLEKLPVRWMLAGIALIGFLGGFVFTETLGGRYDWTCGLVLLWAGLLGWRLFDQWLDKLREEILLTLSEYLFRMVTKVSFHNQTADFKTEMVWTEELKQQKELIGVLQDEYMRTYHLLAERFHLKWRDATPERAQLRLAEFLVTQEMNNFRYNLGQQDMRVKALIAAVTPPSQLAVVAK